MSTEIKHGKRYKSTYFIVKEFCIMSNRILTPVENLGNSSEFDLGHS